MTIDKREKVLVPIDIGNGMDESVAEESAGVTSLSLVENAYYSSRGKLSKRHGVTYLNNGRIDGTTRSYGRAMDTFRDSLVIFDGETSADVYSPSMNTCVSVPTTQFSLDADPIAGGSGSPQKFQSTLCNGYIVSAYYYNDSESVVACVHDSKSLELVSAPVEVGTLPSGSYTEMYTAAANTCVHVVYADAANGTINSSYINLYSTSTINSGFQTGFGITDYSFAAGTNKETIGVAGGAEYVYLAYPDSSYSFINVKSFSDSGSLVDSGSVNYGEMCSLAYTNGSDLWLTSISSSTLNINVFDVTDLTTEVASSTASLSSLPTYVDVMVLTSAMLNTSSAAIVASGNSATQYIQVAESGGSLSNVISQGTINHWHAVSQPFSLGGITHVAMRQSSSANAQQQGEKTIAFVDITDSHTKFAPLTAVLAPRLAYYNETGGSGWSATELQAAQIHTTSSGAKAGLFPRKRLAELSGTSDGIVFDYVRLSANVNDHAVSTEEFSDSLYKASSVTESYDGLRFSEVNFVGSPAVSFAQSTGSGNIGAGTRLWTAVFEYVDASGNLHWSEPAPPTSVTTTGSKDINVSIWSLAVTNKTSDSDATARNQIAVYRTVNAGTTFYRVGAWRDTGADQEVQDTVNDNNLQLNAKLYTQPLAPGGSLPHQCPPAGYALTEHQDRIFCVDETGKTIWYSAPRVQGEAAWFNNEFTIPVERGGKITAMASFDNRLIIFKRDRVFVVSGNGPPESGGSGNEFSPPYLLPAETGCIAPESIVVGDSGIYFQSDLGIEFLDRRLQVSWVGEKVKDTLAAYPYIADAVAYTDDRVAFCCRTSRSVGSLESGVILVHQSRNNTWSTYKIEGSDGTASIAIEDIKMLELDGENRAWLLDPQGGLYVSRKSDDASLYYDSVNPVRMKLETNWVRLNQSLTDRQRVYNAELGLKMLSNVSVNVAFAYDYDSTFSDETRWSETVLGSSGVSVVKKHAITPQNMAVKIRVQETANVNAATIGTGQGFEILGLSIEAAAKGGAHDPSADNKG